MLTNNFILGKLPRYNGNIDILTDTQSVNDIIAGIRQTHKKYATDYDRIAWYFVGRDVKETCKNIFTFLRQNTRYNIEGEELQTLRSPAAIIATGLTRGIDCKNYSLFAGGVLDAINRLGLQVIPFVYRFASDKYFDDTPNHVFIVAFPGSGHDIYIDPIPESRYFNEHHNYNFYQDKKINSMLQILSGRISGGAFGFGENKLRDQMLAFINKYATAFMYLYLPDGSPHGREYGFNSGVVLPGIPQIVKDKKNKAFITMWDWGQPTGLKAESDIVQAIRRGIVAQINMQPEEYWSKKLGVNIPINAAIGFSFTDAADLVVPGSGSVLDLAGGVLDSFVPDLSMTYPPSSFAPEASDWNNTIYAARFKNQPGTDLINQDQTTKKSGVSPLLFLGLVGAAIYILNRKK